MWFLLGCLIGFLVGVALAAIAVVGERDKALKEGKIQIGGETYNIVPFWKDKPVIDGEIVAREWR